MALSRRAKRRVVGEADRLGDALDRLLDRRCRVVIEAALASVQKLNSRRQLLVQQQSLDLVQTQRLRKIHVARARAGRRHHLLSRSGACCSLECCPDARHELLHAGRVVGLLHHLVDVLGDDGDVLLRTRDRSADPERAFGSVHLGRIEDGRRHDPEFPDAISVLLEWDTSALFDQLHVEFVLQIRMLGTRLDETRCRFDQLSGFERRRTEAHIGTDVLMHLQSVLRLARVQLQQTGRQWLLQTHEGSGGGWMRMVTDFGEFEQLIEQGTFGVCKGWVFGDVQNGGTTGFALLSSAIHFDMFINLSSDAVGEPLTNDCTQRQAYLKLEFDAVKPS